MSTNGGRAPALLQRQRTIALAGLLGVAAVAWVYLWVGAVRMDAMPMSAMTVSPWAVSSLLLVFVMWTVMMVGMMLPSAAPAILLYGAMAGSRGVSGMPAVWVFTSGYLAVWTLFSLLVTLLQAGLVGGGFLTPMMTSASVGLTAGVLVAAGLYQWLPVKEACLRKCRDPLQTFLFRRRAGPFGAFRMGVEHGAYCVGCCWALMLVMFAAGVMNLLWVALIAALVFVEKLVPGGAWIGRIAGLGFGAAAVVLIAQ